MKIDAAQADMRHAYLGGSAGIFASSLAWMSSALVAQAAISSLLADNTRVKLQLRRLRESAGQLTSAGAMHREG